MTDTGPSASVRDVAVFFKVSTRTVHRWMEKYQIPYVRIGGVIRFDLAKVAEWAEEQTP